MGATEFKIPQFPLLDSEILNFAMQNRVRGFAFLRIVELSSVKFRSSRDF